MWRSHSNEDLKLNLTFPPLAAVLLHNLEYSDIWSVLGRRMGGHYFVLKLWSILSLSGSKILWGWLGSSQVVVDILFWALKPLRVSWILKNVLFFWAIPCTLDQNVDFDVFQDSSESGLTWVQPSLLYCINTNVDFRRREQWEVQIVCAVEIKCYFQLLELVFQLS